MSQTESAICSTIFHQIMAQVHRAVDTNVLYLKLQFEPSSSSGQGSKVKCGDVLILLETVKDEGPLF